MTSSNEDDKDSKNGDIQTVDKIEIKVSNMNILDKLEEFKDFKDAELSTTIDDSKGEEDHLKVNEESMDLDGE